MSEDNCCLDPAAFGAVGDGVSDDTDAWRRTIEAAAGGGRIGLQGRTYLVREVVLCPGVGAIVGPGTFRGALWQDSGLIHCGRAIGGDGPVLRGLLLAGFTVEVEEARCGIELVGVEDSVIRDCRVVTSRNLHKGIWLRDACHRVAVRGNTVLAPPGDKLVSLVCVTVESKAPANYYFHERPGQVIYTDSSWGNVIDGNTIKGGTHGVALGSSSRNRIVNNLIVGNNHRNINICPACRFNIVSHNQLLEAGSSAVAMAYGSCDNIVTDNQIASWHTMPGVDRDAIHAYVASGGNRIAGNVIVGTFRYGVYLAASARGNLVESNRIRLQPNPLAEADWSAGIGLETDWRDRPLPAGARFSRQNYGAPPENCHWAYEDSTDNAFRDNLIEAATCGIYLAQIGDRALTANQVAGNRCLAAVDVELYVHAPDPAYFHHNQFGLDRRDGSAPRITAPDWLLPALDS